MNKDIPASSFILQPSALPPGDCIDCSLCAQVCPTGIDIRGGLQIECVACAQCIDACDRVMDKIGRPRGLIRYTSQDAMSGQPQRILRPRVAIYLTIIVGLLSLLATLIATKSPLDVTMLRSLGRPFVITENGNVENTLRVKLTNRTDKPMRLSFGVVNHPEMTVSASWPVVEVAASQSWTEPLLIMAPPESFKVGSLNVIVRVFGENGLIIDRKCRLLGPAAGSTTKGAADVAF